MDTRRPPLSCALLRGKYVFLASLVLFITTASLMAAETASVAANAINQLGLELQHKVGPADANLCLSPYSIQSAFAMVFAGADGQTREEMAKTLHFPEQAGAIDDSMAALAKALERAKAKSVERAALSKQTGGPSEPITLDVANRLFGQKGYAFEKPFLSLLDSHYRAPLEELDFRKNAEGARQRINGWVEDQTKKRIRDLIPSGALNETERLVLVNAVYLKSPWADEFNEHATAPAPFHIRGGETSDVPTMARSLHLGYKKEEGFSVVALPYSGGGLQFLIILPDKVDGLGAVEAKLSATTLAQCAKMESQSIILHLPKFKIAGTTLSLRKSLEALGMKTAFDIPQGSADFGKIAPKRVDDYLFISDAFHKTFIAVDEKGTEAAAATAIAMAATSAMVRTKPPLEIHVDHPFLYAVQEVSSGACLFLGRVTDPR